MSDTVAAALVTVVGTLAGTLGALFLTRWFDDRARQHSAEERAEARHVEHRVWHRDRRQDAYVALLRRAHHRASAVRDQTVDIERGKEPKAHIMPSAEDDAPIRAQISAFCPAGVDGLYQALMAALADELNAAKKLRDNDTVEARTGLRTARTASHKAMERLELVIRGDLATPPVS